ncbi:hypothetical protein [Streptomyces sp. NPDC002580]|uniref:hypothetical protein n=1 Tax=Streptomyces sp. NPDC002580 TaxID=3364653 RepID=UPI003690F454
MAVIDLYSGIVQFCGDSQDLASSVGLGADLCEFDVRLHRPVRAFAPAGHR